MVDLGPTRVHIPKPGDIGLTQIAGRVGRAIRIGQWLTGCGYADYEHAFGVSRVDGSTVTIVEAEPGGAREVLMPYDPTKILWLRCPPEHRRAVAAAYRELIGTPYSFADYQAIALHRLHLPAPHLKHFIESSDHMICSQLVDAAAAKGGWHLFKDHRWSGYIKPCDLFHLVAQQQAETIL